MNCETFDLSNPEEIPYVTIQLPVLTKCMLWNVC